MLDYAKMLNRINNYIANSGYPLSEIAKRMGISQKTLKSYMSGKTVPKLVPIRKLCIFLNIGANVLLGLDKTKNNL